MTLLDSRVVVAVPAYNEGPYIEEALSTLSCQTHTEFRVLVADNASTDGTSEIIRRIARNDPRILHVRHERNLGATANFAFCLEETRSEYFMWCGAHDTVSANFLEVCAAHLDADASISMAFGCRVPIDASSEVIGDFDHPIAGFQYRFSPRREVRYLQSLCRLNECTIINGLLRRRPLTGASLPAVLGVDHVLLSRLLWFGDIRYDHRAEYRRRYFRTRTQTQLERIRDESISTERESTRSSLEAMIRYYLADTRALGAHGFPQSRLVRELIRRVLTGRFLGGPNRKLYRLINKLLPPT